MEWFWVLVSVALGISLAASAGLRAFLPLFIAGLLARLFDDVVTLSDTFSWLSSTPALIALGVAVVVEVVADKVPALDHALDAIQTPVRTFAGMIVAAAVMAKLPGWATVLVSIVAGGGAAFSVHATKSALRVGSTAATAGAANPILSLVEDGVCLVTSVLSIVLWFVALFVAALVVVFVGLVIRWLFKRRKERKLAAAAASPG